MPSSTIKNSGSKISRACRRRQRLESEATELQSKTSKSSTVINGFRNTRTHNCIICLASFLQREPTVHIPQLSREEIMKKSKNSFDEFHIFFVLEKCIGVAPEDSDAVFSELVQMLGEPAEWGISFCPDHDKAVQKGLEISSAIQRLEDEFLELKTSIKNSISYNLIRHQEQVKAISNNAGLRKIINVVEHAMELSDSSPSEHQKNRKGKRKRRSTPQERQKITIEMDQNQNESHHSESQDSNYNTDSRGECGDEISVLPSPINSSQTIDNDPNERSFRKKNEPKRKKKKAKAMVDSSKDMDQTAISAVPTTHSDKPNSNGRFKCTTCSQRFESANHRNNHHMEAHGLLDAFLPFECQICGSAFSYRSELRVHEKRHENQDPSLTCKHCFKSFSNTNGMTKHVQNFHSADAFEVLKCVVCKENITGHYNLKSHMNKIHPDVPKPVRCRHCDKSFWTEKSLNIHKRKEHNFIDGPVACNVCGNVLANQRNLRNHIMSQHQKNFKFNCRICGAGSLYKSSHERHMRLCQGRGVPNSTSTYKNPYHNRNNHSHAAYPSGTRNKEKQIGSRTLRQNVKHFSSQNQNRTVLHRRTVTTRRTGFSSHEFQSRHAVQSAPRPRVIPFEPNADVQSQLRKILKTKPKFVCFNCDEEFPSDLEMNKHKRYGCEQSAF